MEVRGEAEVVKHVIRGFIIYLPSRVLYFSIRRLW